MGVDGIRGVGLCTCSWCEQVPQVCLPPPPPTPPHLVASEQEAHIRGLLCRLHLCDDRGRLCTGQRQDQVTRLLQGGRGQGFRGTGAQGPGVRGAGGQVSGLRSQVSSSWGRAWVIARVEGLDEVSMAPLYPAVALVSTGSPILTQSCLLLTP